MSIRLAISVEGLTEERFVKDLLQPHLLKWDIHATPVIVATSRSAGGIKFKGGGATVERVGNELRSLLRGYRDGYVTSFYDYYGFGGRLPGETVEALEERISATLAYPSNLISYIQLHEFEGLLFSAPVAVADYFNAPMLANVIERLVREKHGPENVNDGPETAPSKRLERMTANLGRSYSKTTKALHGPLLAARLTLPVIRAACPRFGDWLTRLEVLTPRASVAV